MRGKIIKISLVFMISFIAIIFPYSNVSHASWFDFPTEFNEKLKERVQEYAEQQNEKALFESGELNKSPFRDSEDERFFYRLEAGLPEDEKAKFWNVLGKVNDSVTVALNETLMAVNNVLFWINKTFTSILVGVLELSNNSFFVDKAIDKISAQIKSLVGVSGGSTLTFTGNGMFLPLLKIISMLVVIYAFYKLVWKRSFVEGFGELFKFIIVLAVSLLLFTNYSSFIKGMNSIGTEVSGLIVGSSNSHTAHGDRLNSFSESLWYHFVDEPYMVLQYGTTDLKKLSVDNMSGRDRVRALLRAGKGSALRNAGVDIEINGLENYYMSYDSVIEKTYLNLMFLFINGIVSLPIYIIALALVFTQFWFVIIALIAPFALLIASFPSQFNVMKRYFFELSLPLLIRVALSFILIMLMFLNNIVRELSESQFAGMFTGSIGLTFLNGVFYIMLFFGIFLLRKRIMGMLSSGSEMVGQIREGLGSVTTKPIKSTVQTTATVGGAVVGGMVGGPAGAMQGASMGATVGKVATGGSDGIAGATQDIARTAYQGQMLRHLSGNNGGSDVTSESVEGSNPPTHQSQDYQSLEQQRKETQGKEDFNKFMEQNNISENEQENFMNQMSEQGVDFSKVNENTLQRNFDLEEYSTNPSYASEFASKLKTEQVETQQKIDGITANRIEKFNDFLSGQNLTDNEINYINENLEKNGIDPALISKSSYQNVDSNIRQKLQDGKLVDYKKEFVSGIKDEIKNNDLRKQKERIMSSNKEINKNSIPTTKNNLPTSNLKKLSNDNDTPKTNHQPRLKQEIGTDSSNQIPVNENVRSNHPREMPFEKGSNYTTDLPIDNMHTKSEIEFLNEISMERESDSFNEIPDERENEFLHEVPLEKL